MSQSEPTRDGRLAVATLEMNRQGPSPRGALTPADGRRTSFAGWVESAAVIEDWRASMSASGSHRERPGQETGQGGSDV